MTKEKLMEWGLTEEQANKVMEGLNGSFVTKSRFNEVNEEKKTLKAQVSERDGQIETLKKSAGDNTELQNQITALQEANKQKDKDHANEIKALKISNAVDVALTNAKAKFKGAKAAEKSDPHNQPTGDDLSKMSYDELCKYMEENPDAVLE
jgi:hypothetical protein